MIIYKDKIQKKNGPKLKTPTYMITQTTKELKTPTIAIDNINNVIKVHQGQLQSYKNH
ncbi:hypothetical protein HanHA300_Chr07g0238161 [Helianthus annuus]|nr:hypothetical protein HanHA300_Chr07g0238161 [Helianthus annuus]KAJ0562758.1 hypothetical protein HanHA89_Chr07g0255341 [Helianthus annuus]